MALYACTLSCTSRQCLLSVSCCSISAEVTTGTSSFCESQYIMKRESVRLLNIIILKSNGLSRGYNYKQTFRTASVLTKTVCCNPSSDQGVVKYGILQLPGSDDLDTHVAHGHGTGERGPLGGAGTGSRIHKS